MTLWQRWKQTSLPNKLLVSASILMAFGTLFYGGVAIFQYRMMREQSETTKGQLRAMQEQSNVMQRSLDTFRDQANSMKSQTNTLDQSLAETRKSVNAAEKQASASQSQANTAKRGTEIAEESLRVEHRPSLGVLTVEMIELAVGKPVHVKVIFQNFGRSPTKYTDFSTTTWLDDKVCPEPPKDSPILGDVAGRVTIPINVTRVSHGYTSVPFVQEWLKLIQSDPPKAWVYVYSRAEYQDSRGGKYFTELYGRYNYKLSSFDQCGTHNDAN